MGTLRIFTGGSVPGNIVFNSSFGFRNTKIINMLRSVKLDKLS